MNARTKILFLLLPGLLLAQLDAQRQRGDRQRLPMQFSRNHETVKKAFLPVVAEARRSTVRVLSRGGQAGLGAVVGEGLILTHASGIGEEVSCELSDGRSLPARIIGRHKQDHLVLLQVDEEALPVLKWATDQGMSPGSWVVTPGMGEMPMAVGVLSVEVHTRAPNPTYLGVQIAADQNRVRLLEVLAGTAAAAAGLRAGDIILSLSGKKLGNRLDLTDELKRFKPGNKIKLQVRRGDDDLAISATLGRRAPENNRTGQRNRQEGLWGPLSKVRIGFTEVLQHDSVLRPNQLGGPVVNLDGVAVGLNISRPGRIETLALSAKSVRAALAEMRANPIVAGAPKKKPTLADLKANVLMAEGDLMFGRRAERQRAQEALEKAKQALRVFRRARGL